jgi:mycothiol synthase
MAMLCRPYGGEGDYRRIRAFLQRVMVANGLRQRSWHVARLDYWRWHGISFTDGWDDIDGLIFIWETSAGEIAAVLNPENPGEAFIQIDPSLRSAALEGEMLAVAEEHLSADRGGLRRLVVWAHSDDTMRRDLLVSRGYRAQGQIDRQGRRSLCSPIPRGRPPAGYMVRALGGLEEHPARSWVSWRAFHPNSPDVDYQGWEWYARNIQGEPLYRGDLDIVAVAPTGELASFCTIWLDDSTGTAYFEPVGTAPEHQRRGLGTAVLCEGLRRLRRLGAVRAFVAGSSAAAIGLYTSVGFSEADLSEPWAEEWPLQPDSDFEASPG